MQWENMEKYAFPQMQDIWIENREEEVLNFKPTSSLESENLFTLLRQIPKIVGNLQDNNKTFFLTSLNQIKEF